MAHAGTSAESAVTREKLVSKTGCHPRSVQTMEVGATIAVHTGPGSICIAMSPI